MPNNKDKDKNKKGAPYCAQCKGPCRRLVPVTAGEPHDGSGMHHDPAADRDP